MKDHTYRPRVKRGFSLVPMDDQTALIRSATRTLVMRGDAVTNVLPQLWTLLDGTRSSDEIAATLTNIASPVVEEAIGVLSARDLLESENLTLTDPGDQALAEFFESLSGSSVNVQSLKETQVMVVGDFGVGKTATFFTHALAHVGVGHVKEVSIQPDLDWTELIAGNDLVMFMPERPELQVREALHAACLSGGIKVSVAEFLSPTEVVLGPTVVPGDTACWTCHDLRVQAVEPYHREYKAFQQFLRSNAEVDPVVSRFPALAQILAGMAAFEAVRIITNVLPPLTYGAMMTLDVLTGSTQMHDVLKVPRCSTCSPVNQAPARRIWSW